MSDLSLMNEGGMYEETCTRLSICKNVTQFSIDIFDLFLLTFLNL